LIGLADPPRAASSEKDSRHGVVDHDLLHAIDHALAVETPEKTQTAGSSSTRIPQATFSRSL
jgi:hypothetical protein